MDYMVQYISNELVEIEVQGLMQNISKAHAVQQMTCLWESCTESEKAALAEEFADTADTLCISY